MSSDTRLVPPGARLVRPPGRRRPPVAALVFLASLVVYLSNGHSIRSGDTVPAGLLPIAVLIDGSLTLDSFAPELKVRWSGNAYFLHFTSHGVASFYPVAAGLLAIPVYALPVLVKQLRDHPTPAEWLDFAPNYEKLSAAIITALSAAAFWRVCRMLGFGTWLGIGLTALYAFGSEAFSTSAQALWQHGPGCLAVIAAIGGFVALDRGRRDGAWILSLAAGLAVAFRINNLLLAAPLMALALWHHPRQWLGLILPGAAVSAALCAYNLVYFDLPLGPYQTASSAFSLANVPVGLAGTLVSPGRGLLVYFPAALVALALLLRHPALLGERLVAGLALGILAATGVNAAFETWWGGFCFGPRYFAECEPAILLILGIALARLTTPARRWVSVLCFAVVLPYSTLVQAIGVYSHTVQPWNTTPRSVDDAPDRLWDVVDNPILRGLRGYPPGGG